MHKYLEKKGDVTFEKIFRQRLGKKVNVFMGHFISILVDFFRSLVCVRRFHVKLFITHKT